jgi:hypothetical protein
MFKSRWICNDKNSLKHTVVVMYGSSPRMIGEEDGLFGDLTSCSSGRQSDDCGWAVRSGSDGDLSSCENESLRKRNSNEGREWMWRRIMRLRTPFELKIEDIRIKSSFGIFSKMTL